jgi:hypothetical protein
LVISPLWAQELSFEHLGDRASRQTGRQSRSFLRNFVSGFCFLLLAMPTQLYNQPFGMLLSLHNRSGKADFKARCKLFLADLQVPLYGDLLPGPVLSLNFFRHIVSAFRHPSRPSILAFRVVRVQLRESELFASWPYPSSRHGFSRTRLAKQYRKSFMATRRHYLQL